MFSCPDLSHFSAFSIFFCLVEFHTECFCDASSSFRRSNERKTRLREGGRKGPLEFPLFVACLLPKLRTRLDTMCERKKETSTFFVPSLFPSHTWMSKKRRSSCLIKPWKPPVMGGTTATERKQERARVIAPIFMQSGACQYHPADNKRTRGRTGDANKQNLLLERFSRTPGQRGTRHASSKKESEVCRSHAVKLVHQRGRHNITHESGIIPQKKNLGGGGIRHASG